MHGQQNVKIHGGDGRSCRITAGEPFGKPKHRWIDNIQVNLKEILLAGSQEGEEFADLLMKYYFLRTPLKRGFSRNLIEREIGTRVVS